MGYEEWDEQPWWYAEELLSLLEQEGIIQKPETASDITDLPVNVRTISRKQG